MSTNSIILAIFWKILVIGLEPILFIKKSDFKSDVSTNFTKRAFCTIPQFDILTLGAQVFGLLITLSFFYYFSITTVIPNVIEVKKFRTKKIIKNTNTISSMNLDLINNKKLIDNSYKLFMQ